MSGFFDFVVAFLLILLFLAQPSFASNCYTDQQAIDELIAEEQSLPDEIESMKRLHSAAVEEVAAGAAETTRLFHDANLVRAWINFGVGQEHLIEILDLQTEFPEAASPQELLDAINDKMEGTQATINSFAERRDLLLSRISDAEQRLNQVRLWLQAVGLNSSTCAVPEQAPQPPSSDYSPLQGVHYQSSAGGGFNDGHTNEISD